MAFQRHSKTITVWWARLSFPHIWEPQPIMKRGKQVGDPRFSTLIVLDPAVHKDMIETIRRIEEDLIQKSWGGRPPAKVFRALKPGEEVRPNDANLKGKLILSANTKADSPPQVYEKMPDGANRLTNDRALIYSGCEAHVNVGLYTDDLSDLQICTGLNIVIPTKRVMPRFDNRPTIDSVYEEDVPKAPELPEETESTPVQGEWERRTSIPANAGAETAGKEDWM